MAAGGLRWANSHKEWNIWSSIQRHQLQTHLQHTWEALCHQKRGNVQRKYVAASAAVAAEKKQIKSSLLTRCLLSYCIEQKKKKISVFQQTWLVWPCSVRLTAWGLKQTPALSPVRTVPHRDFSSTQEKTCRLQKLDIWNRRKRKTSETSNPAPLLS